MRFRVLGPVEIRTGGDWAGIGAPKWRRMLAALVANAGYAVSIDQLIAEIWDDDPPRGATNLVSIYAYKLRRTLGDDGGELLRYRAPGYLLAVGADDVDSLRFGTLVSEGRQALADSEPERAARLLTEALNLWRGRAYADARWSRTMEAEAERLEAGRLDAQELSFTAAIGCGRHAEIIPELIQLTADHPLREGLWSLLMQALDRGGRHAEALSAYARAREVISDELGVYPGEALQSVYQEILTSDMRPRQDRTPVTPKSRLAGRTPTAVTDGAGRQGELAATEGGQPAPAPAIRDAAGYSLEPNPLEAGTPAEFVKALRDFRIWAADDLSLREMARLSGGLVSYSAIGKALGGDQLPSHKVVVAVITACGGTEAQLRAYVTARRMIRMAQEGALPPPVPGPGTIMGRAGLPERGADGQSHVST